MENIFQKVELIEYEKKNLLGHVHGPNHYQKVDLCF